MRMTVDIDRNGERDTVRRLLLFRNNPEPGLGSMLFVPTHPAGGIRRVNRPQIIQGATGVLGTVATLIFAQTQITAE